MQPFNKSYTTKSHFTLAGVYEVPDMLVKGDWGVKIDLKHGRFFKISFRSFIKAYLFSLLSCPHKARTHKVPELYLEWPGVPIHSDVLWDDECTVHFLPSGRVVEVVLQHQGNP